jgi:hypothetical protein
MHALEASRLTHTLQMVSYIYRQFSSIGAVHVLYHSFLTRFVTLRMKNSIMMLLTGWLSPFFQSISDLTGKLACWIYWQVSVDLRSDLQLLLSNCIVTAEWRPAAGRFFKLRMTTDSKYAPVRVQTSDPSTRIILVHSQTHDTVPVIRYTFYQTCLKKINYPLLC